MKTSNYLRIALGLPEGIDLNEVYVPASIVPELMDNFKTGVMKTLDVKYAGAEVDESQILVELDRCPHCNSSEVGKLDDTHDVCGCCKSIWGVKH